MITAKPLVMSEYPVYNAINLTQTAVRKHGKVQNPHNFLV